MAKNNGKAFEEDFRESFPTHFWTYRPHDSGGGMMARFTHESICDLITFNTNEGKLNLFELKSTVGTSVNFRPYEEVEAYLSLKDEFEMWNANLAKDERKSLKEEIKDRRREVKMSYKALNNAMIKYHQILTLYENQRDYGIMSYIAITFLSTDSTFLLNINDFVDHWKVTTKKSINQKELEELVEGGKCTLIKQENKTPRSKRQVYSIAENL